MLLLERRLDRMQRAAGGQRLDGGYLLSVSLDREHGAGLDRCPVEQDGTGAAMRGIAPDVGPRESKRFP